MTPEAFIKREEQIQQAQKEFPGLEIGEAYKRWGERRGIITYQLRTNDETVEASKEVILHTYKRPCDQAGCDGQQVLEGVCPSCVEGLAGFQSKWTCKKCLHRELSKKTYLAWFSELKEKENGK